MKVDQLIKRKPNEQVIFFLRRHWIIFFGDTIEIMILGAVPMAVYFLLNKIWPSLLIGSVSWPLLILLASAYYLIIWLFFINTFIDYYLDAWIVTTDKVVNIEQNGLFSRTISELDLSKVQDVTSEVKGVIPSIFNFGNVYVQTAGEVERFDFEQIPRPHEIRKNILELVEEDRKRQKSTAG